MVGLKRKRKLFYRGVTGGWAIAHPVFGRIEGADGQRQQRATLLTAHPVFGSQLRPWEVSEMW